MFRFVHPIQATEHLIHFPFPGFRVTLEIVSGYVFRCSQWRRYFDTVRSDLLLVRALAARAGASSACLSVSSTAAACGSLRIERLRFLSRDLRVDYGC